MSRSSFDSLGRGLSDRLALTLQVPRPRREWPSRRISIWCTPFRCQFPNEPALTSSSPACSSATNAAVFKETIDKLKTPEGQETLDKVRKLKELAESLDTTVTRLSLAWTIRPGSNVSTCILGASKPEQILDNLAALDVVEKLTPELLEKIEAIVQNKPEGTPTYGR